MGLVAKTVGTVALAGATFVAGLWLGGDDLSRTKVVIDEMVEIIQNTKEDIKDKDEKVNGIVGELQKANLELDKANK